MGSYSDHLKSMEGTQDVKQNNKCWHHGCPLRAAVIEAGRKECAFHHGQKGKYHSYITDAIINNMDLIENYNKMVTYEDWSNPAMVRWLKENTLLPMKVYTQGDQEYDEPISLYVARYFEWMTNKILAEATEMIRS